MSKVNFLKECLYKRVAPQCITSRIIKSQARPTVVQPLNAHFSVMKLAKTKPN